MFVILHFRQVGTKYIYCNYWRNNLQSSRRTLIIFWYYSDIIISLIRCPFDKDTCHRYWFHYPYTPKSSWSETYPGQAYTFPISWERFLSHWRKEVKASRWRLSNKPEYDWLVLLHEWSLVSSIFYRRWIQPRTSSSRLPRTDCYVRFAPPNERLWHQECSQSSNRLSALTDRYLDPPHKERTSNRIPPNRWQCFASLSC